MANNLCCLNLGLLTLTGLIAMMPASQANPPRTIPRSQPTVTSTLLQEFPAEGFEDLLSNVVIQGDRIFFAAISTIHGKELWVSDGTSKGTQLLKDILPVKRSASPVLLNGNGSIFWFQINDPDRPLWQSNGTENGTLPIPLSANLKQRFVPGLRLETHVVNGQLIFPLRGATSTDLWQVTHQPNLKSNLQPKLLYSFANPAPGQEFFPQSYTVAGNQILFAVGRTNGSTQLWRTDGTTKGTIALQTITPAGEPFTPWQNRVYLQAETPDRGWEIWTSNGTAIGTQLLKDINPGKASSAPRLLTGINQTFFFVANSPQGEELWATQGTPASTRRVKLLSDKPSFRAERTFAVVDDRLFFATIGGDGKSHLWVSDGTEKGTQRLTAPQGLIGIGQLKAVGSRVFFSGSGTDGTELWVSDGTAQGTRQVKDLYPGTRIVVAPCAPPPPGMRANCPPPAEVPNGSSPTSLTAVGDRVYFIATDGKQTKLWRSDGTAANTTAILDLATGEGMYAYAQIVQLRNQLLMTGFNPSTKKLQLWSVKP